MDRGVGRVPSSAPVPLPDGCDGRVGGGSPTCSGASRHHEWMELGDSDPFRRFIWESVLAVLWFSAFAGWVLFVAGAGAIPSIIATSAALPAVWAMLAQPLWITVDAPAGTVTVDFLPGGLCGRTFEARRITYETGFKRLEIDLPQPVLRRRTLKLFRPGDRKLLAALNTAGAIRIKGS